MDYIGFAYSALVAGGGIFGKISIFSQNRWISDILWLQATSKLNQFLHSLLASPSELSWPVELTWTRKTPRSHFSSSEQPWHLEGSWATGNKFYYQSKIRLFWPVTFCSVIQILQQWKNYACWHDCPAFSWCACARSHRLQQASSHDWI